MAASDSLQGGQFSAVVHHRRFGMGQVESVEGEHAVVRFGKGTFKVPHGELNKVSATDR